MRKLDAREAVRVFRTFAQPGESDDLDLAAESLGQTLQTVNRRLDAVVRPVFRRDLPSNRMIAERSDDDVVLVYSNEFGEAITVFAGGLTPTIALGATEVYDFPPDAFQEVVECVASWPGGGWLITSDLSAAFFIGEGGYLSYARPGLDQGDRTLLDLGESWRIEKTVHEIDAGPLDASFSLKLGLHCQDDARQGSVIVTLRGLRLLESNVPCLACRCIRIVDIRARQWERKNYKVQIGSFADSSDLDPEADGLEHHCGAEFLAAEVTIERF